MRFYQQQHEFYCGVDLHARSMHVCIVDQAGQTKVHKNIDAHPDRFLPLIRPYREGLVVAAECMFAWYWLADLCAQEQIPFVLGHALYMKAIHGGKTKNDRIDSQKIALLLKGGMLPVAYAYPKAMRATRDLLRRRTKLVRTRAEALAHIQNTVSQYNLPPLAKKLTFAANREEVAEQFADESVRQMAQTDLSLIGHLDEQLKAVELYLVRHAKIDDPQAYHLLQTIPGVGKVLALILLYEMHAAGRFGDQRHFVSYCRLVRPTHESAGKKSAGKGHKIGNAHLRWAFGCLPDAPGGAGGPDLRGPPGEAARQSQGHFDSGGADCPQRLADAQTQGGFRCQQVPEIASVRRRRVSRGPHWANRGASPSRE
jgi:transposase